MTNKHVKWSELLVIRESQMKNMSFYYAPIVTANTF